jgi:hypothetical protein
MENDCQKRRVSEENTIFPLSLITAVGTASIWCYCILTVRKEFGGREKSMKERPTESSYLITVYCSPHTYQIKTMFSSYTACLLFLRFEHIDDGMK